MNYVEFPKSQCAIDKMRHLHYKYLHYNTVHDMEFNLMPGAAQKGEHLTQEWLIRVIVLNNI